MHRDLAEGGGLHGEEALQLHARRALDEVPRDRIGVLGPAVLHGEVEGAQTRDALDVGALEALRARAPQHDQLGRRGQLLDQVGLVGEVVAHVAPARDRPGAADWALVAVGVGEAVPEGDSPPPPPPRRATTTTPTAAMAATARRQSPPNRRRFPPPRLALAVPMAVLSPFVKVAAPVC